MIEKWEIRSAGTPRDPKRFSLLVKCAPADIQKIIRKASAICGRPRQAEEASYSHLIYLRNMNEASLAKIRELVESLAPAGAGQNSGAGAVVEKAVAPVEEIQTRIPPPQTPEKAVEAAAAGAADIEAKMPAPQAPEKSAPIPQAAPPAVPAAVTPGAAPIEEHPAPPARPVAELAAPGAPVEAPLRPVAGLAAPEAPAPSQSSGTMEAPGAPVETPLRPLLDPDLTFENFVVGSQNRFAHAAIMSALENPGSMYNPLLIYGEPFLGKTHLLTAMAMEFSQRLSKEQVLFVAGIEVSQLSLAKAKKAEVLLVDDVHLIAVREDNRSQLAGIFDYFLNESKQVVLSCRYPPKALAALESSLGFSFSQGWSTDLKTPGGQLQRDVLEQLSNRWELEFEDADWDAFIEQYSGDFFESASMLRRLKRVKALFPESKLKEWVDRLKLPEEGGDAALTAEELQSAESYRSFHAAGRATRKEQTPVQWRLAVFYPKGKEAEARYSLQRLGSEIDALGLAAGWKEAAFEPYDSEQWQGAPFLVSKKVLEARAQAVWVLGPESGSKLQAREKDIAHLVGRAVSGHRVPFAWLPFAQLKQQAFYSRLILDLI
ncbi:MAG: hypothetical protein A3G41_02750 [Elusimicrobia bacterium RIFCSPLOWO2_12_FULL_59_9]|nr:MAG: hypothetical protein A3G41_02750 [Elusimicrobia bacterium RIFCSPLOWO2_12_FULL_59_9]